MTNFFTVKYGLAISTLIVGLFLPLFYAAAGTILSAHKYAWSNNVGYINFENVTVNDNVLDGYAWSTNSGFINFSPAQGGVLNNGAGDLSGSIWGEQLGWIDFSNVSINSSTGKFSGTATGTLVGTISFDCTFCDVETDWRPTAGVVGLPSLPSPPNLNLPIPFPFPGLGLPSNTLIKYEGSSKVYVIENGFKRWIQTADDFIKLGYDWKNIRVIPNAEIYPDGSVKVFNEGQITAQFVTNLAMGSKGPEVTSLQQKLKSLGFFPIGADTTGFFGPITFNAVKAFQRANGLSPVGYVGSQTRQALNLSIGVTSQSVSSGFNIGNQVMNIREMNVRRGAGIREGILRTQTKGSRGILVGGPVKKDGYTWWQVEYVDKIIGWTVETGLKKAP